MSWLLMLACFVQSKTSFDVCLGSLSCWSAHFFSHLAVVGGSLIHSQRDEATTTMLCRWYSVLRFESLTFNHISFIFFEG